MGDNSFSEMSNDLFSDLSMEADKRLVDGIVQWTKYLFDVTPSDPLYEEALRREIVLGLLKKKLEALLGAPVEISILPEEV
jgi:hypothetical protein